MYHLEILMQVHIMLPHAIPAGKYQESTHSRHTLVNGLLGFTDAFHRVINGLIDVADSRIRSCLHGADNLVQTCLLTVPRVINTRHCGFDQKHDITGIRLAVPVDKSEIASDSSRIQDSNGNREVPSTVRLNTGHVITILVVRTRRIIQARPSEPSDFLPVIQGDKTDDLAVIVRLIDGFLACKPGISMPGLHAFSYC